MREVFFITDPNGSFLTAVGTWSMFEVGERFVSYGEAQARIDLMPVGTYCQIQKFFLKIT